MMSKTVPHTLICTVGTSLFKPNLFGLPSVEKYEDWLSKQRLEDQPHLSSELIQSLKTALSDNLQLALDKQNWKLVAEALSKFPGTVRLCGAEINSITDLIQRGYCTDDCVLVICHSATNEGLQIATILKHYYEAKRHQIKIEKIEDLQDSQPKLFRTKGLRNLAKTISRTVRGQTQFCAINATGGYKAQIAIGVLMGQALGVPVYYKHEMFSEIIAFPPMPISLDFSLWLEKSELFTALERWEKIKVKDLVSEENIQEMVAWQDVEGQWDERLEALVEREECDGKVYLAISPTGQIFHETFKGRFESVRDSVLPASVPTNEKEQPRLSRHNWGNAETPILNFLQRIVADCSYVRACRTDYWNPDLPSPVLFKLKADEIEGIFSNATWTVKFIVETSAKTLNQRAACIADMNRLVDAWM